MDSCVLPGEMTEGRSVSMCGVVAGSFGQAQDRLRRMNQDDNRGGRRGRQMDPRQRPAGMTAGGRWIPDYERRE